MRSHRRGHARWVVAGVLGGRLLHGLGVWWTPAGFAQGSTNTTFTTSTSSSTSFESPPACSPVGSSETEQTLTLEQSIGPGTIVIGNRDEGGTPFEVLAGTTNINANTHTHTVQCVAAVPVLPWPAMLGLGLGASGLGAWTIMTGRKRRDRGPHLQHPKHP